MARAEGERPGVGERFVVIEIAAVLVAKAKAVLAPDPGDIVRVDIASVRRIIGKADTHPSDGSTLIRRHTPAAAGVKPEDREHRARQVIQTNLLCPVLVQSFRWRAIFVSGSVIARRHAVQQRWREGRAQCEPHHVPRSYLLLPTACW